MSVGEPWDRIDIVGPNPPSARGHKYILTVIDYFTGWAEVFPIRSQDALTAAKVLAEQVFSRYGCPRQILSDQGPCFEAELFQHLCRLSEIGNFEPARIVLAQMDGLNACIVR